MGSDLTGLANLLLDVGVQPPEVMRELMPDAIEDCVTALSQMNGDKRVVLYLDATMSYGENWLPTLNVEGDDGFYRFPDMVRDEVARFFGPDYSAAKRGADFANRALGVDPAEALDIVAAIMFRRDGR
jgi:hypothetical protein